MYFLKLHREELGILPGLACSLAAFVWQGFVGFQILAIVTTFLVSLTVPPIDLLPLYGL